MYYKVIQSTFIVKNTVLATDNDNYGKFLEKMNKRQIKLFDLIIETDKKINMGVDLYHSIWRNLATWGGQYIDRIESLNEPIALSSLLMNNKHDNFILKQQIYDIIFDIQDICQRQSSSQWSVPDPINNGTNFWEYLYEKRRKKNFNNICSRLNSYFVFTNENDCKRYRDNIRGGNGEIVGIEIVESNNIFESDMQLMDKLENHFTINTINTFIDNYWNRIYTQKPIIEIMFQGKFKIIT